MAKKIKIYGLQTLYTDETIQPGREYGLFLTATRTSEEIDDDDPDAITYKLKVSHIDQIIDLREQKPVNLDRDKNFTKSQRQRWKIEAEIGKADYDSFMDFLFEKLDGLLEDYKNRNLC